MADVSYVIDVAASMPGGETTLAQLDQMSSALVAAGASTEQLAAAFATVQDQLTAATAASATASAALAEGVAHYDGLEKAAVRAAAAAEKAAQKNGGVVPPELAARAEAAQDALNAYGGTLLGLEVQAATAAEAQAELSRVSDQLKAVSNHTTKALQEQAKAADQLAKAEADAAKMAARETEKLGKEAEAAARAEEALGTKGKKAAQDLLGLQKFEKIGDAFASGSGQALLAVGAFAAVAVAIAAVTAAVVVGAVKVAAWAVGLADANRSARLTSDAMQALHPELKALEGTIAAVSAETGAHNDELQELAGRLKEAKVNAADMPAALRAAALAEAALGKGGSADLIADLKAAKGAVGDLASEYNDKLGPIVRKQMLGLNAQSERFRKNISDLFGGLNIDPVLQGLETLVALFDKNTAAGQAMQFLFESVFQPLIDQAQNAAYVVEAFVLGFLIGLTKLYIAVKPAIKAVKEFFGFNDTSLTDTLDIAKIAGEAIVPVFLGIVAVFGVVAAIIGAAVVQFAVLSGAVVALVGAAIYLGVQLVSWVVGSFSKITDFLSNFSLLALGTNIVQGLVDGIVSAGPKVLESIVGIAKGAITAAKNALGIHSPSTVFAELGVYTGEGYVQGVDAMAGDANAAMVDMMAPPPPTQLSAADALSGNLGAAPGAGGQGGAATSAGGIGGGAVVNITGNNFYGVKDAQDAADKIGEVVLRFLEGGAAALGQLQAEPAQ